MNSLLRYRDVAPLELGGDGRFVLPGKDFAPAYVRTAHTAGHCGDVIEMRISRHRSHCRLKVAAQFDLNVLLEQLDNGLVGCR